MNASRRAGANRVVPTVRERMLGARGIGALAQVILDHQLLPAQSSTTPP